MASTWHLLGGVKEFFSERDKFFFQKKKDRNMLVKVILVLSLQKNLISFEICQEHLETLQKR